MYQHEIMFKFSLNIRPLVLSIYNLCYTTLSTLCRAIHQQSGFVSTLRHYVDNTSTLLTFALHSQSVQILNSANHVKPTRYTKLNINDSLETHLQWTIYKDCFASRPDLLRVTMQTGPHQQTRYLASHSLLLKNLVMTVQMLHYFI